MAVRAERKIRIGGKSSLHRGGAIIVERIGEKDPDGEGSEGVNVDILGGDSVGGEGRISWRRGLLWARSDAEFVGRNVDAGLQAVLQQELKEYAVELHGDARHRSFARVRVRWEVRETKRTTRRTSEKGRGRDRDLAAIKFNGGTGWRWTEKALTKENFSLPLEAIGEEKESFGLPFCKFTWNFLTRP